MNIRHTALAFVTACLLAFPVAAQGRAPWEEFAQHVSAICRKVKPAVVHIEVISRRGGQRRKSLGSGLVVSAQGKIVTNHHVIDHAESIHVLLDDGTKHPATLLRQDKATDLAVLEIRADKPLASLPLGDSDKIEVGEWVLAVGNPFGFDRTVSLGIVSGKRRFLGDSEGDFRPINDFLQTDASIDHGSSGGPLINLKGEVIGINSVGIGRGQGFTIPSKTVREVLEGSQVQGQLERGWLGLFPQPLTRELRSYWGVDRKGIVVSDVAPGSPAEVGGLRPGDVVVAMNGQSVGAEKDDEVQQFAQNISRMAPGSPIVIDYWRAGSYAQLRIQLAQQPRLEGQELDTDFGAVVAEVTLNDQLQYRLESPQGVVVRQVNSNTPAEWAGLTPGDLILECDGKAVNGLAQLQSAMKKRPLLLKVRQGRLIHFALIEKS